MRPAIKLGLSAFAGLVLAQAAGAAELKIALIAGKTGPLEAYAKQTETGLMMGLEYLTKGTMEANGRKVTVIVKDDQLKADLAKTLLEQAYSDDKVDIAIGTHRRRPRLPCFLSRRSWARC